MLEQACIGESAADTCGVGLDPQVWSAGGGPLVRRSRLWPRAERSRVWLRSVSRDRNQEVRREFNIECAWCKDVLVVTIDASIDPESGQPRTTFCNTADQAAGLHEHWRSHAAQRAALLAGQIDAPPPGRPGWPRDEELPVHGPAPQADSPT